MERITYDSNKNYSNTSSPKDTVDLILTKGAEIACDTTFMIEDRDENKSCHQQIIPEWFDEHKFKCGQKFFHDNIFAMLVAKFCGLLTILTSRKILKILMFTNKSGTSLNAYKRYMATILHMYIWYSKDLKPGSDLWHSINSVRTKHVSANRRAVKKEQIDHISQMDMALTQFGFMGLVLIKTKTIGIHTATNEELEGFIHFWRVIGYLMGIDDRFNICHESVKETTEICQLLFKQQLVSQFKSAVNDDNDDFQLMSYALIDGMRVFSPFLNYGAMMTYIAQDLCETEISTPALSLYGYYFYRLLKLYTKGCQFYLIRIYLNWLQYLAFFLIAYFPFIGFFKFGFKHSYVRVH